MARINNQMEHKNKSKIVYLCIFIFDATIQGWWRVYVNCKLILKGAINDSEIIDMILRVNTSSSSELIFGIRRRVYPA